MLKDKSQLILGKKEMPLRISLYMPGLSDSAAWSFANRFPVSTVRFALPGCPNRSRGLSRNTLFQVFGREKLTCKTAERKTRSSQTTETEWPTDSRSIPDGASTPHVCPNRASNRKIRFTRPCYSTINVSKNKGPWPYFLTGHTRPVS